MVVSEKEKQAFKNIDWMMPEFDLAEFCHSHSHIVTYCPEHFNYTGRIPSDPKFYIDKNNGKCHCKTEDRGSNLIWTVHNLFKLPTYTDAYKFIVGKDIEDLDKLNWSLLKRKLQGISYKKPNLDLAEDDGDYSKVCSAIEERVKDPIVYPSGYEYFIKPPNKKRTDIVADTVNFFKVYQETEGFYRDRVVVPVFLNKRATGFVAIDILGKEEWIKRNPLKPEKSYKKLLYPKNFKSASNLFNYDNVEEGADYLILVEGVRDAMKLWQLGYRNVCALLGVNISAKQRELISLKYPAMCYVMLDGDDAGYENAIKLAKKLHQNIDTKVPIVPRGHDPKTISAEVVHNILSKAVSVK